MKAEDKGPRYERDPKTGLPTLVGKDTNLSEMAEKCLETVAMDKYDGDDPSYFGKTRLETAVLSLGRDAAVDPRARTEFLDRIIGKPTQKVESKSMNLTLYGFLDQVVAEEAIASVVEEEEFLG